MLLHLTLLAAVALAAVQGADPGPSQGRAAPEGPPRPVSLPSARQFSPELQYNLLEPQFQYPSFNYIPEKQPYPRVQPPVVFYAGGAPPGQQFLLRPGAPPGNFLIPQPQPQPGFYGGNPQGPVFVAGYPKPAHIPPIEKDAEEVPNLAGNHPVVGRAPQLPQLPQIPQIPTDSERKPEKLETLDEPIAPTAGEADVLAEADKNPAFPKKPNPAIPALRPGQQFFILNGNPLYSNFPLQGAGVDRPQLPPTLHQVNPDLFVYRQLHQFDLQPHQLGQVPVQDLFLRNAITGQISDVKPISAIAGGLEPASARLADGNYISLNHPDDFRQNYLFKDPVPVAAENPLAPQKLPLIQKEYFDGPLLLKAAPSNKPEGDKAQVRLGKSFGQFVQAEPFIYDDTPIFSDYYKYSNFNNGKEEDDSVVIDAKAQSDDNKGDNEEVTSSPKTEEPSLSQAQPAAIALAGSGGVAAAAPRGTALTGAKGLAVARPQATAVAGPPKEEAEGDKKQTKRKQ